MAIEQLTHDEKKIVFACICAVAKGPFFPPGDYSSRLGIERDALFQLIAHFSTIDDNDPDSPAARVINNSMNEVCHGVRISPADWQTWFDVDKDAVRKLFKKWRQLQDWDPKGENRTSSPYFNRLR